jgi:hypothetical protein
MTDSTDDLIKRLRFDAELRAANRRLSEYGPAGGNPDAKAEDHDEWRAADCIEQLEIQLAEAVKLLREAREDIEDWGAYASQYFQDKHDLKGCLATYDVFLSKQESKDG